MTTDHTLAFAPPGPGAWELETTHYARPCSRFLQGPLIEGFGVGFAESTARYGLLLDRISPAIANDFVYQTYVPFGAPPGAKGPPPKLIFQLITRLIPKLRARIRTSHDAFANKVWRDDLKQWDDEVRPASDKRHRELQAIDPAALTDDQLVAHLKVCRDRLRDMIRQHHRYSITCGAPIGDLIAHVQDWTGKTAGEILQVMRGSSQISLGVAAAELDTLAAAIRADATAAAVLRSTAAPAAVLDQLLATAGAVGTATRVYLDVVSYRCLGYDVASRFALEMPEVIVRAIVATIDGTRATDGGGKARVDKLRGEVPAAHHAKFDELVGEAQLINRLRDERGHYSDGWAIGIARRAVLESGRRLVKRGVLDVADNAVDLSNEEHATMLGGNAGPSLTEIKRRSGWRTTRTVTDTDIPAWLGHKPSGPPPASWLPEHGRRAQRAIDAFLAGLFAEPELARTATSIKGLPVSAGSYEGPARLVGSEDDFGRVQQGDVLVTRSTSPYFNVVLPLLGAIVTDRGGQLCHAAIVAREYGIPGVVGTREATKLIADGARVRVDGTTGEVTVL